jgi:hypothetical protein
MPVPRAVPGRCLHEVSSKLASCPLDPAPYRPDDLIDVYKLCSKLAHDESAHDRSSVDGIIEHMDALWPEDHRRYRCSAYFEESSAFVSITSRLQM